MTHPARFDGSDPYLLKVRELCLALPDTAEKVSHGHPNFHTTTSRGKVFCIYGGVVKGDHWSEDYARAIMVLPPASEREALVADERFFVPAYYGPSGWVGLNFRDVKPNWEEVNELIIDSYRMTAAKTLIKKLDEQLT